jgi:hypothetical protein
MMQYTFVLGCPKTGKLKKKGYRSAKMETAYAKVTNYYRKRNSKRSFWMRKIAGKWVAPIC